MSVRRCTSPARHLAALAGGSQAHPGTASTRRSRRWRMTSSPPPRPCRPLPRTPERVVHGDPKISNLVYAEEAAQAICMLDLDTVGRMALPFELGDAFRSWCNAATEDDPRGSFSAELFAAAVDGLREAARRLDRGRRGRRRGERHRDHPGGTGGAILRRRLNESYFGWNPALSPAAANTTWPGPGPAQRAPVAAGPVTGWRSWPGGLSTPVDPGTLRPVDGRPTAATPDCRAAPTAAKVILQVTVAGGVSIEQANHRSPAGPDHSLITGRLATRPARIPSKVVLGGDNEVVIVHGKEEYLLRITHDGKLVLSP
jgi:hemin uptake protein HemP